MTADLRQRIMALGLAGLKWDIDLSRLCTMRVGGPALAVIRPGSVEEARTILALLSGAEIPWRVMGRGSNILAPDSGYHGVLVVMGLEMAAVEVSVDKAMIRVEAGCSLARLLHLAVDNGLGGLEFAAGIPGSVGGAVVMNAGSGGGCTADVLDRVEWLDSAGKMHKDQAGDMDFSYRAWGGEPGAVVMAASFALKPGDPAAIRADISVRLRCRGKTQPVAQPSFGSVFKNPPGDYAARLIEAAGLKGLNRGEAMISARHANFIVNCGRARAADVLWLIDTARARVAERFAVELETEVHLL